MVRITQLQLPVTLADGASVEESLRTEAARLLRIHPREILKLEILRRSLDARRGHELRFSYTVEVQTEKEARRLSGWSRLKNVTVSERMRYREKLEKTFQSCAAAASGASRPVVIGFGPAGMFAALILARMGLSPLILERGKPVEQRAADIETFWKTRVLDPESNVQFGEGGAGTFSDGKLNTLIKDPEGIGRYVLEEFVSFGAPEDILMDQKPHIGTDRLRKVAAALRAEVIRLGAAIEFEARVTDLIPDGNGLQVIWERAGKRYIQKTQAAFLGIGHSARDTFQMLQRRQVLLSPKPFAVGFRIEHPQSWVNEHQYRSFAGDPALKAASYKLTWQDTQSGRGVYSFCMCPGGQVVAAASEKETVVTNGMSNYAREGQNANSALLVTIEPEDLASFEEEGFSGALAGVAYQKKLEKNAYLLGGSSYRAPVQQVGAYLEDCQLQRPGKGRIPAFAAVVPGFTAGVTESRLKECLDAVPLPGLSQEKQLSRVLARGIVGLDAQMSGFADDGAVLTGIESRSSSPVRIVRNEQRVASMQGLYPIGEGAGYAGGIMSAAIDGIRSAVCYLESLSQNR